MTAEPFRKRWCCPDGGTCHHECDVACSRVLSCGPLSGSYPGDEWPAEVLEMHRSAAQSSDILDPSMAEQLAREWEAWERLWPTLDPDQQGSVLRWLLVHCFGTEKRWWTDPVFHAQVEHAARALERLDRGRPAEQHWRSGEVLPHISDEQRAHLAELSETRRRARS